MALSSEYVTMVIQYLFYCYHIIFDDISYMFNILMFILITNNIK